MAEMTERDFAERDGAAKFVRLLAKHATADKGMDGEAINILSGIGDSLDQGDLDIEDVAEMAYRQLTKYLDVEQFLLKINGDDLVLDTKYEVLDTIGETINQMAVAEEVSITIYRGVNER